MNKDILFCSWKELKTLQNRKLHYFITHQLYPFSPYYRQLFDKHKIKPDKIKTVGDLKRIPSTTKQEFIQLLRKKDTKSQLAFLLQPNEKLIKKFLPKQKLLKIALTQLIKGKEYVHNQLEKEYRPIFLTVTAGTTRLPIPFLYTGYDLENLRIYGKRIIEVFGIKTDERAVNIFPYAPHLAFWQTVFAGLASNVFVISSGGGKTVGTRGNVRIISNVKPQFLIGVPSYVYHVLKSAKEQNCKLGFLKEIILGAARVPEGFKLKLANLAKEMDAKDVKIIGTYGFTEARCAWGECPTEIGVSSGYHSYPDKEVFEIIDPRTQEVKDEGEDGELVYTNIDARGSCVLRYRTGDLVKGGIIYQPCPYCGRTVPRISSDISRASNIKNIKLTKIKETLININNLEQFLDDMGEIDDWQIEIVKKDNDPYEVDELVLNVCLLKNINKEEFLTRLNESAQNICEVSFNKINYVSHKQIQEMLQIESAVKAQKIVDKRGRVET